MTNVPARSEEFEAHMDRWTRRRTTERLIIEWERANLDCVLFLALLCRESSPATTSEAVGVREGQFALPAGPSDFIRDSLEETISMHGRQHGIR
jgi:hypothetical protein